MPSDVPTFQEEWVRARQGEVLREVGEVIMAVHSTLAGIMASDASDKQARVEAAWESAGQTLAARVQRRLDGAVAKSARFTRWLQGLPDLLGSVKKQQVSEVLATLAQEYHRLHPELGFYTCLQRIKYGEPTQKGATMGYVRTDDVIEAKAQELLKRDPDLTREQARVRVMEPAPEQYAAWQAEERFEKAMAQVVIANQDRASGQGAHAETDRRAQELVTKSATPLTLEQARVKVWEQDPDLFARCCAEDRAGA